MPPRPRTSVTWDGSSLAPLLNRMGSLLPRNWHSHARHGSRQPAPRDFSLAAAMAAAAIVDRPAQGCACARAVASAPAPTTSELVGQRLMVAMKGTRPSPALLGRIRRGEIGGVILFGFNIASPAQLRALTTELQSAARAAGRPPLLIATDQEGGRVRRLPWAGPAESATELGASSAARIRRQALLAGRALRAAGVTVDLAPVADVPGPGSFMAADDRTFGASAAVVGTGGDRVRARARRCAGRRGREALPGDRQGHAQHGLLARRDPREPQCPRAAIWRRSAPRSEPACRSS